MDQAFQNPKYLRTTVGRWVEQHLPRRWSLYPAAGSYVTPARAPAFDWEELRSLEPEAFVWRGAPFAIHMRRNARDKEGTDLDHQTEDEAVWGAVKLMARAKAWTEWGLAVP